MKPNQKENLDIESEKDIGIVVWMTKWIWGEAHKEIDEKSKYRHLDVHLKNLELRKYVDEDSKKERPIDWVHPERTEKDSKIRTTTNRIGRRGRI